MLESLKGQGVGFRSLTEAIDTESATCRLLGHIIGALAEFERGLIIERTQAGIKAAKRRSVKLGRKPKLSPPQVQHARVLIEKGTAPRMSRGCLAWRGQRSMQRWPDRRAMPEHKRRAVSFCEGVTDM